MKSSRRLTATTLLLLAFATGNGARVAAHEASAAPASITTTQQR